MNLKNKLKGLPTIYYVNLDHRSDRREYMESQFDHWKIKNYHRISSSKYLSSKDYEWQHLLLDDQLNFGSAQVGNSITHLEMIKNWLKTTDDEYMIMMEDDYDLSLIEYWNFDWEYLMNKIPKNWDCIQLGFENDDLIPFFLHPLHPNHGFGPCLINRSYAEKLIRLHCFGDKFKLNIQSNDDKYKNIYGMVDCFLIESGKTYSIPLITTNVNFGSDYDLEGRVREWHEECRDLYHYWWKNEHHKFTLDEFFSYNKSNDMKMIKKLNYKKNKLTNKVNYI